MGQDKRREKPRRIERGNLAEAIFGDGLGVGSWYFLHDVTVGFGGHSDQLKWRPWVVAVQQQPKFGVKAFPRSQSSRTGLWHERHTHTRCKVRGDGYIQIYDLITLEAKHLKPDRFSCYESDKLVTELVCAAGEVLGREQATV